MGSQRRGPHAPARYIFVLKGSQCFENFTVSSSIRDDKDESGLGCKDCEGAECLSCGLQNVVKVPLGLVVIGLFAMAVLLHTLFVKLSARIDPRTKAAQTYEKIEESRPALPCHR